MAGKIVSSVLVYSPSWPVSQALYSFCQHEDDNKNTAANADVNVVIHAEDILHKINEMKPDVLVLDISLRVNCGLMSTLRQNYPSLPVVIVQRRFLFSDRVAAEYFGHIWLKEYDALLAGYPAVLLQEHLSHPGLAGTECGGNSGYLQFVRREQDSDDVQREMVFRLRLRLFDLLKSPGYVKWSLTGWAPRLPLLKWGHRSPAAQNWFITTAERPCGR
ncbi:hypothetical protein [Citrobacter meridianamericanus]|uniref:hypothetical protein n=1 Tax=Citrobacter meridianamericanus TaxID=2894201 RepID=UPI00351D65B8